MARWILDSDAGTDDAQAIFIAMRHLDLAAITCVSGNTGIENVVKNVGILTGIKGRTDIPIFKGCGHPLVKEIINVGDIHGADGFGGQQEKYSEYIGDNLQEEHAVNAIIRIANEEVAAGRKINIATDGPLTNLAMAIRLDPTLPSKVDKYYCMGGTIQAWGNITLSGEFNFYADPEAARIVYENMPMIHQSPWEAAEDFFVTDEDKEQLFTPKDEDDVCTQLYKDLYKEFPGRMYVCDGLVMAAAVQPDIVGRTVTAFGRVETQGTFACGSVLFTHADNEDTSVAHNTTQLLDTKHTEFIDLIDDAIKN